MLRYALIALSLMALPAHAIQCPDGRWMDSYAHCDYEPTFRCEDGSYRDKREHCTVVEEAEE